MEYLDFEVEISPTADGDYTIAVMRSPAGEARERMRFRFSELQLESRLKDLKIALLRAKGKRRRVLTPEEQTVQNFGRELFDLLLPNELRGLYRASLSKAYAQDCGLRLKLRLRAVPELAILPWEFLYDQNEAEYICLSQDTPIVRYLELPRPPVPLKVTAPLRILGMIASPTDLPALDVAREKERVEQAVAELQAQGQVEITWLSGQTWRDLRNALRRGKWHIFHFIGHGGFDQRKDEGFVAFCDRNGREQPFMASELARLLANQRALRLVLLNACEGGQGSQYDIFSSAASILVRRGIPAVLAMQYEITDRAAIELARSFYEALTDGLPVDTAVTHARQAIGFAAPGSIEWVTPVLYMRSPDGKLFDLQAKAAPLQQPKRPALKESSSTNDSPFESFTTAHLVQLQSQMAQAFNVEELKDLCFQLGVAYENIPGEGRDNKVRELIQYLERRGQINALLTLCEQERPNLNWRVIKPRAAQKKRVEPIPSATQKRTVKVVPTAPAADANTFIHEKTGLEFVRIPAGEFLYGDDKQPKQLAEYWISKTPVTQAVYQLFIIATPQQAVPFTDADWAKSYRWDKKKRTYPTDKRDHPVMLVSWRDAIAFCQWADVSLPTEEQWEKAARGTDGRKYPWGDENPSKALCNFGKNIGSATPVGRYSPQGDSPYGCVDMSGNVWEWCLNKYYTSTYIEVDKSIDYRVLRGGSWGSNQGFVRVAYRFNYNPDNRNVSGGFRVVVRRPPSR